jgi:hypothetical protein
MEKEEKQEEEGRRSRRSRRMNPIIALSSNYIYFLLLKGKDIFILIWFRRTSSYFWVRF